MIPHALSLLGPMSNMDPTAHLSSPHPQVLWEPGGLRSPCGTGPLGAGWSQESLWNRAVLRPSKEELVDSVSEQALLMEEELEEESH